MVQKRSDLKILKLEGRDVPLAVRRVRHARNMTLRLDEASGAFRLSLPYGVALADGLAFAERRGPWMAAQLASLPPRIAFRAGAVIPILGLDHRIRHDRQARRGVWREPGQLWVSGFPEHLPRRVADYLKAEARRELSRRALAKAEAIGRRVAKITLRDTRSRWGSCTAEGQIAFSWRLILAPEAVLDYVVAHEVAHLAHLDHGPGFWRLAATLTADVAGPRRWLKNNGGSLLRYG